MLKEHSKEQLWKLYEKLPEELKEAIFSEGTAENIYSVCSENGVEDDKISEIAFYTGYVLMGVLPVDEFQKTIEKEVGVEEEAAKKISQGIFRFVFYPVKTSLGEINKTEISPGPKISEKLPEPAREEENIPNSQKSDSYREPIE